MQEFRRCIECYLCQDVCHVLREHRCMTTLRDRAFWCIRQHWKCIPLDAANRTGDLKNQHGIGFCNITKCCTKVCPEGIAITDNAIIPLKERVVDDYFDPVRKLFRILRS